MGAVRSSMTVLALLAALAATPAHAQKVYGDPAKKEIFLKISHEMIKCSGVYQIAASVFENKEPDAVKIYGDMSTSALLSAATLLFAKGHIHGYRQSHEFATQKAGEEKRVWQEKLDANKDSPDKTLAELLSGIKRCNKEYAPLIKKIISEIDQTMKESPAANEAP